MPFLVSLSPLLDGNRPFSRMINQAALIRPVIAVRDRFSVPVEATAFLGAVAGFVVLLLALFLYLSRKWCFTPPSTTTLFGGVCVPLCESSNSSTSQITKNIGKQQLRAPAYTFQHSNIYRSNGTFQERHSPTRIQRRAPIRKKTPFV